MHKAVIKILICKCTCAHMYVIINVVFHKLFIICLLCKPTCKRSAMEETVL